MIPLEVHSVDLPDLIVIDQKQAELAILTAQLFHQSFQTSPNSSRIELELFLSVFYRYRHMVKPHRLFLSLLLRWSRWLYARMISRTRGCLTTSSSEKWTKCIPSVLQSSSSASTRPDGLSIGRSI